MTTRRARLKNVNYKDASHAGLWLDKYIVGQETKDSAPEQEREASDYRRDLVDQVWKVPLPEVYRHRFSRWRAALVAVGATCRTARVQGRMVVGLGAESVLETAISLHHTYGVPYIPGTALKGLAAAFARQHLGREWQPDTAAYRVVFGTAQSAGYVTFFDALPIPDESKLLQPDVITVHHKDYYARRSLPPADWDDPNPIPCLTAGGCYLVALAGPDAWVEATFKILGYAFQHLGIGARTSSGYGRLELDLPAVQEKGRGASLDPAAIQADALIREIEALRPTEVAGSIQGFYERWKEFYAPAPLKRRVAEAIRDKMRQAGQEKKLRQKPWYQELHKYLE